MQGGGAEEEEDVLVVVVFVLVKCDVEVELEGSMAGISSCMVLMRSGNAGSK